MDSFCYTSVLGALVGQLLEEKVSGFKEWRVGTEKNPTLPPVQAPTKEGREMGKRHFASCVRCPLLFYVEPFIYFEDTRE
jgi:hypothetical protein